jgi:hypothetical protein
MEMGYGLDGRGSIPAKGMRFFLPHSVQSGSGAQPAFYSMGTMRYSSGAKRPEG